MKKFLVLGIGNAQVDLLEYLSGRYEIHALANSPQARGYPLADHFETINITDKQQVLDYARAHDIDAIYSVGSDVAMPTVSYVAEQMGLPLLVSSDTAEVCNNKVALRNRLKGVYGAVEFALMDSPDAGAGVPLPAMLKPVDSQGQRGVQTITDPSQIPAAFENAIAFSRSKQAILERKIDGPEISVNAYMRDGEMVFFLPSGRQAWPQFDGGIIHKHLLPGDLSPAAVANVHRLASDTVAALQIANGPVYFQIKMDGDTPYLIEVTPRLDGCHMWRFIEAATGVNLLDAAVTQLLGGTPEFPDTLTIRPGVLEFFCQPPGEEFAPLDPDPEAQSVVWYYTAGQCVSRMNGFMEKCGFQIVMDPA